jgi:hypothetical protein
MRIRLYRTKIVDRNDLNIVTARFHRRTQDVAPDSAKPVNCYPNCHIFYSSGLSRSVRPDPEFRPARNRQCVRAFFQVL